MHTLGLTGGIACGKTAVARLLLERNVPVVDADAIARDVVAPGSEGLAEVLAAFGEDLRLADGSLDRKALGARVFRDESARLRLNGILHPRIAMESLARLSALSDAGHPFGFYDAALLVENGSYRNFEGLVVVVASPAVQRARLMARDGLSLDDAQARIDAQWPLERKVAVATHVIDNSGTREALEARVGEVFEALVAQYGPPPSAP